MSQAIPNLRHPYHLPSLDDGDTNRSPGDRALKYVRQLYSNVVYSGFANANEEVTTNTQYYRLNDPHHDVSKQTSAVKIFDEVFILPLMPKTNSDL